VIEVPSVPLRHETALLSPYQQSSCGGGMSSRLFQIFAKGKAVLRGFQRTEPPPPRISGRRRMMTVYAGTARKRCQVID